jgi:hypothetical protein
MTARMILDIISVIAVGIVVRHLGERRRQTPWWRRQAAG